MVVKILGGSCPVDAACVLEDFWGGSGLLARSEQLVLRNGLNRAGDDAVHGFEYHVGTHSHQAVINHLDIVVTSDGTAALLDHITRVNLVLEEEGRHTGFLVTVHHRPVDGGSTAVAGQQ